jgi:molecular chaperone GrpE
MEEAPKRPIKVKVMDKRRSARAEEPRAAVPQEAVAEPDDAESNAAAHDAAAQADLVDDLRRLQAEFDNYRKRVLREQTAMAKRASARLIERLLPVLDNFERALEHGEGGPGIELVYKELRQTLEQDGLTEIDAEGSTFDPRLHEAFQVIDDDDVTEPVVRIVYRRGYRLGDSVLRPAMVVVARPPEAPDQDGAGASPDDDIVDGEILDPGAVGWEPVDEETRG